MSAKLKNKVALVTGASKGIGASIALHLAREGAAVAVNYASSRACADKIVSEIVGNGGKAVAIQGDVSKESDVQRLVTETEKALGKIDILINNAGVYEFLPIDQVTPEHFHRQFNLNVLGLLLTTREALKHFNPAGGSIINISSLVARIAPPSASVYSATKAAVDAITKSLAQELGPRKIRVNALNPGLVETEGVHSAGFADPEADFNKAYIARASLARIGQPKDIANAAVYLASDDSSWVTGETLTLSGGYN